MVQLLTWAEKGPVAAGVLAAALFIVGIAIPPILALSVMVVAFATLRGGFQGATTTITVASVLTLCIWLLLIKSTSYAVTLAPLYWASIAVAASLLRQSSSLAWAVAFVALSGLVTAIVLSLLQPMLEDAWLDNATEMLRLSGPESGSGAELPPNALTVEQIVELAPVGAAMTAIMVQLAGLFLARSGQGKMFNPGGFQREFHALYFGKHMAVLCAIVFVIGMFVGDAIGMTLTSIALFLMVLQCLAVLHSLVKQRSLSTAWLVGVYVLLILGGPIALLAAGVGFFDNFRRLARQ